MSHFLSALILAIFTILCVQIYSVKGLACDDSYFRPLCANNHIKFKNLCWLKLYNYYNYDDLERTRLVHCHAKPDVKCPAVPEPTCQPGHNPVCAYDSYDDDDITYDNLCDFRANADCNPHLYFVKCGPCTDDSFEEFQHDQCLNHSTPSHPYEVMKPTHHTPPHVVPVSPAATVALEIIEVIEEKYDAAEEAAYAAEDAEEMKDYKAPATPKPYVAPPTYAPYKPPTVAPYSAPAYNPPPTYAPPTTYAPAYKDPSSYNPTPPPYAVPSNNPPPPTYAPVPAYAAPVTYAPYGPSAPAKVAAPHHTKEIIEIIDIEEDLEDDGYDPLDTTYNAPSPGAPAPSPYVPPYVPPASNPYVAPTPYVAPAPPAVAPYVAPAPGAPAAPSPTPAPYSSPTPYVAPAEPAKPYLWDKSMNKWVPNPDY